MDEMMMTLTGNNNDEFYNQMMKNNLENRTLIINETIDDSVLEDYAMYIIQWNREDKNLPIENRKPIWIILNSEGGEVLSGIMLINVIKASLTPINCLIAGLAASMASYIPMVCTTTYDFPNSVVCLHDGQPGVYSTSRKASDMMDFYKSCDDILRQLVIENTNMSPEFLDQIADREFYIFADKAMEYGIVDEIICTLDEVLF